MKQQDLRVVKTVNNIESTFIALLEEQGFASITVQDILDRALINRKTFYRYYRDKYDLAETVIRKFFKEINGYFLTQQQETEKCRNRDTDLLDEAYQALYNATKRTTPCKTSERSESMSPSHASARMRSASV